MSVALLFYLLTVSFIFLLNLKLHVITNNSYQYNDTYTK